MAQSSILTQLRAATADAHAALETEIDLFERVRAPAGRRALVAGFHGLHAEVEARVEPWLAAVEGLGFVERRRSGRTGADLMALGATPRSPGPARPAESLGEALGLFYVVEGSSLGGRVVRDRLAREGISLDGLGFLDPYGHLIGDKWRGFVAVLAREHEQGRAREADILSGGVRGFETARTWLVPGEANG